jgi:3-dehydroquinate dehydratase
MENKDFNQIYHDYLQQSEQNAISEASEVQEIGKERIVAVRKNEDGDLIAFKTETGRELDYITALNETKAGKIAHVDVFHKYGRDILRSEPDGIKENNLDQLPDF